ncbi:MAG: hypothetical protein ABSD85_06510 [Acidimicrobiales bacterium]|jgi:NAD(P)H-flavin reductase
MPTYVVVARIALKPTTALNASGSPVMTRAPDTWHLAEIGDDDKLSQVHVCGVPVAAVEVRHSVREWGLLEPFCAVCEGIAGDRVRAQAKSEAEAKPWLLASW